MLDISNYAILESAAILLIRLQGREMLVVSHTWLYVLCFWNYDLHMQCISMWKLVKLRLTLARLFPIIGEGSGCYTPRKILPKNRLVYPLCSVANRSWKPWKILKSPWYFAPWKNALENPEITINPWKIIIWSRFPMEQYFGSAVLLHFLFL